MRRGIFVTGSDTGVGKTVAAAALLARFRSRTPIRYWKPIQTGVETDDDTAEVARLTACDESELVREGIRLREPVSPHLAAKHAGVTIDVEQACAPLRSLPSQVQLIVEGAGGLLVPLNESQTMADLMRALDIPVVVVVRSTLGTINHTLLTLEALRSREIHVAGVIMNGSDADNRRAIERHGKVRVIAEMPQFEPGQLARWAVDSLDPEDYLWSLL